MAQAGGFEKLLGICTKSNPYGLPPNMNREKRKRVAIELKQEHQQMKQEEIAALVNLSKSAVQR